MCVDIFIEDCDVLQEASAFLQAFEHEEHQFEGLVSVEPGVAVRFVASFQVFIGEFEHSADAFRHVLSGEFEVYATGVSAVRFVHGEELLDFTEHVFEVARLISGGGAFGVSVARVAHPDDVMTRLAHGLDHPREVIGDFTSADARDECDSAGNIFGVEDIEQLEEVVRGEGRAAFHADRVGDSAQELYVCAIGLACSISQPEEVGAGGVELACIGVLSCERLFVGQ